MAPKQDAIAEVRSVPEGHSHGLVATLSSLCDSFELVSHSVHERLVFQSQFVEADLIQDVLEAKNIEKTHHLDLGTR
jgi:hypothetical protein